MRPNIARNIIKTNRININTSNVIYWVMIWTISYSHSINQIPEL